MNGSVSAGHEGHVATTDTRALGVKVRRKRYREDVARFWVSVRLFTYCAVHVNKSALMRRTVK